MEKIGTHKAAGVQLGLEKAALVVKGASQRIVPIDLGVLRNSAFIKRQGGGFETVMTVGYAAEYAIYVHEDLDAAHNEGTKAKFLEQPAREMAGDGTILKIVQSEARK